MIPNQLTAFLMFWFCLNGLTATFPAGSRSNHARSEVTTSSTYAAALLYSTLSYKMFKRTLKVVELSSGQSSFADLKSKRRRMYSTFIECRYDRAASDDGAVLRVHDAYYRFELHYSTLFRQSTYIHTYIKHLFIVLQTHNTSGMH